MRVLGALLGVLALTTLPGVTSCNVMCTDENGVKYACVQCYVWESVPCMAHVWHLPVGAKCLDAQRPALPDGTACSVDGIENGVCNAAVCEHDKFPCTEQGIRDAIALGGGPHTFACDGPTTVTTQAEIVIDNSVILDGEGILTIQGSGSIDGDPHRLFSVPIGVSAEIRGMTLTGGRAVSGSAELYDGLGIRNDGVLTISDSTISENTFYFGFLSGRGGGVYNTGTLTLENSAVSGNGTWNGEGGGVYNTGILTLENSAVSGNGTQHGDGGGVYNTGTLTLVNSAVSDNSVWMSEGGGIRNLGGAVLLIRSEASRNSADSLASGISSTGALTLIESTVAYNDGSAGGYGILSSGETTLINSTVSGNDGPAPTQVWSGGPLTIISSTISGRLVGISFSGEAWIRNSLIVGGQPGAACSGVVNPISGGGNIESEGDTCGFTDPTDLVNVTPEELNLGPLDDNGGPTPTHALLPGSVAIDRIPGSMCLDENDEPLATDQRGELRPGGTMCDVGAFEVQP